MLRAWMSAMPEASLPAGFEEAVLQRVHKHGTPLWQKISLLVVGCSVILTLGYFFLLPKPEIVTVVRVPELTSQTVDLYNLPPAPVREMPVPDQAKAAKARKLHGVAGY